MVIFFMNSSCETRTNKLDVFDRIGLGSTISELNKNGYGLFVGLNSNLKSTEEFYNYDLILVGEISQSIEFGLVLTGIYNKKRPLFKNIVHLKISKDFYSPVKHIPYETMREQSIIDKEGLVNNRIIRRIEIYPKGADVKTLVENYLNYRNCIFLIHKSEIRELRDDLFEVSVY